MQGKGKTLQSYIQRWSIIKNSAEDISDERAVDAFLASLRHSDLVEELGRTRPKMVSELIEIPSRQRRRSRNEDGHIRRNQVAVGYERGEEEGNENREYQDKSSHIRDKPKYSDPLA
jgi:hypothetical protein